MTPALSQPAGAGPALASMYFALGADGGALPPARSHGRRRALAVLAALVLGAAAPLWATLPEVAERAAATLPEHVALPGDGDGDAGGG